MAPDRAALLPGEPVTLEVAPLLRELILHIVGRGMLALDQPEDNRLAGVLVDLVGQARREDLRLPLHGDPRARAAAQRLQDAVGETIDLAVLARDRGASLRSLQRIFLRETGLTLEAWGRKARLIDGMARLASGDRVTTTALDSGYQSVSGFIEAFSRQFGVTPGRYRAAAR